jgi:long-subunit fatty acid transport protein
MDFDMPAHVQIGLAYQLLPDRLTWSFDAQRTFWRDTRGIGEPSRIRLGAPLLGFITGIQLNYDARNTNTWRTGVQYRIRPDITLMAGYAYDQKVFSNSSVDILTYDSDRQMFSLGVGLDRRSTSTGQGWIFNAAAQATQYRNRDIATGESRNLGGVSLPNLVAANTIGFTPNRGPFSFGGRVCTLGVSTQYAF